MTDSVYPIQGVVGEEIMCGAYGEGGGAMYLRVELREAGPRTDAATCDLLPREALRLVAQIIDGLYDLARDHTPPPQEEQ